MSEPGKAVADQIDEAAYETAPTVLTEYHAHEAMDRAHLCCDMFSNYVTEHPYVEADQELTNLCLKAAEALYAVYNAIATKHLPFP